MAGIAGMAHRGGEVPGADLEAVDAGRKISQNQGTEFYIHGKDGKIQNKDSHGNDPYPPKG